MSIESRAQAPALTCPLCQGPVAAGSSGCLKCHLPMADILEDRGNPGRRRSLWRAVWVRLTGLLFYAGIVAWAWYQLPQTLAFVVPAAVVGGGALHVVKGRPWLGLAVFAVIVVAVPLLLWPALGTGTFVDVFEDL